MCTGLHNAGQIAGAKSPNSRPLQTWRIAAASRESLAAQMAYVGQPIGDAEPSDLRTDPASPGLVGRSTEQSLTAWQITASILRVGYSYGSASSYAHLIIPSSMSYQSSEHPTAS